MNLEWNAEEQEGCSGPFCRLTFKPGPSLTIVTTDAVSKDNKPMSS